MSYWQPFNAPRPHVPLDQFVDMVCGGLSRAEVIEKNTRLLEQRNRKALLERRKRAAQRGPKLTGQALDQFCASLLGVTVRQVQARSGK